MASWSLVLFIGLACTGPVQAQITAIIPNLFGTLTASSAGSPVDFPTAVSSGFEDRRIDGNPVTFHYYGLQVPPFNQWKQWTFLGTSGIALDGSPITVLNPNAPEGTHVAFLEDTGSVSADHAFTAGTWRLRFQGAQRLQAGGPDQQTVRVEVGGVKLAEVRFSGTTYEEYLTRPITVDTAGTLTVTLSGLEAGNTALIDDVRLEPIAEWDDPAAWGGYVPTSTNPVVIPAGVAVALKSAPNAAADVTVNGQLLVSNRDATLRADEVLVSGPGALFEVGQEGAPFEQDFTLTLTAPDNGANRKFLMARMGGTLHLHGKPKLSWTRLTATANPLDTSITVEDVAGWEAGDEIVVTGSIHQQSTNPPPFVPNFDHHSEKVSIASVNPVTNVVTLTTPLQKRHHGDPAVTHSSPPTPAYPSGQSWTLDQRAEVGTLTHNVKVQGDAASATSRFGGHIMVMRPTGTTSGGAAYISHVELYRMGQWQKLGRYPMHWHIMLDLAQGQYFSDCSVHETFNRAITIHGTDYVAVERNVVYRAFGHAVFLEDGAEQFNEINENLVIATLKPPPGEELLPSDNELEQLQNRCPASFWITNPMNQITGNVACDTEGTGFWFALPTEIIGQSALDPDAQAYFAGRIPNQTDLGTFDGNVCHTSGSGFDVNDAIDPVDDHILTNVAWRPQNTAILTDFTVYGCDMGVYAGTSPEFIYFEDQKIADNNENIRFAAYHTVRNSLVIANTGAVTWGGGLQRAYVVYDGAGRFMDSHVMNFDQPNTYVVSGAGAATLHPNPLFSGLSYNHVTLPTIRFDDYAGAVNPDGTPVNQNYSDPQNLANGRKYGMALRDLDGSLWGSTTEVRTVIGNHPLMYVPNADVTPAGAPSPNVSVSSLRYGHFRVDYPGVNPSMYPVHWMKREPNGAFSDPGTIPFEDPFTTGNHKQTAVIVEGDFYYRVYWTPGLPFNRAVDVIIDDVEPQDAMYVILEALGAEPGLSVLGGTEVFTPLALRTATTTSYLITATDVIVKYAGVNKSDVLHFSW